MRRRSQAGEADASPVIEASLERPPLETEHPDPAVAEALQAVQQAFQSAETSMENVHKLPSARLTTAVRAAGRRGRSAASGGRRELACGAGRHRPSARDLVRSQWDRLVAALEPVLQVAAVLGFCSAMHAAGGAAQVLGGLVMALGIGAWGYRKSALSASGPVSGR